MLPVKRGPRRPKRTDATGKERGGGRREDEVRSAFVRGNLHKILDAACSVNASSQFQVGSANTCGPLSPPPPSPSLLLLLALDNPKPGVSCWAGEGDGPETQLSRPRHRAARQCRPAPPPILCIPWFQNRRCGGSSNNNKQRGSVQNPAATSPLPFPQVTKGEKNRTK